MSDETPSITGVDFVCVPATDFDAMSAFYGETLGLASPKPWGELRGIGLHHRHAPTETAA